MIFSLTFLLSEARPSEDEAHQETVVGLSRASVEFRLERRKEVSLLLLIGLRKMQADAPRP